MYIIKKPRFFCKKPRFFCDYFGAKSKIKKWRKSAKKFFHFCEKMCCKKTLVFLQQVKSDSNEVCACLCNFHTNRFSAIFTLPTTPWSPPPMEGNPPCRHPGAGRDPVLRSAKLALFCFITQVDDKCRQLDTARPRYDGCRHIK